MNRIILIGNGFDLAHGLKTSYKNFLSDYWANVIDLLINKRQNGHHGEFYNEQVTINERIPVHHNIDNSLSFIGEYISLIRFKNDFLKQLTIKQFLENWVDIEFEYFENLKKVKTNKVALRKLNSDFNEIKTLLITYLKKINIEETCINIQLKKKIRELIYQSFTKEDFTVVENDFNEYPNEILFLNFNYTNTECLYEDITDFYSNDIENSNKPSTIHIHGTLENESSNPVIFGYGDEIDEEYKELEKLNDTACFDFIKSIAYLDSSNYKKLLSFINKDNFQILIMGHSCGVSDRTLLNTIFEHKNCCSIKPYYHQMDSYNDNYSEIIKNITRNFNNKSVMRERVVNKTLTKPLA